MLKDKKKDFIFNTIGSIIYALNSVILLMLVVQIVGAEKGGVFSIAFTISQTLAVIGHFEMRVFQVTDTGKYTFQDFFLSRVITSAIMILGAVIWIIINSYSKEKALIIFLLCCYRLSDSFGDVIEGYYQHEDKLYLSGIFLSLRTAIPTIIFIVSLLAYNNLVLSCLLLFVSAIITLFVFDFYMIMYKDKVDILGGSIIETATIIKSCFPLFISSFLSVYITNAPKYAIDKFLNEEMQTYYSIIFMPSFAINLFSGFIFKPFLLNIVDMWESRDVKRINRIIMKMIGIICLITIVSILAGSVIGIPLLQVIYGVSEISKYKIEFLIILLGGGINAINTFFHYILTVMRKQNTILITYLVVAIETIILSNQFVKCFQLMGGTMIYIMSVVSVGFLLLIITKYEISKIDTSKSY